VIGDPVLGDQSAGITLPRWNGTGFNGGYGSIREAFEGLVNQYGVLGAGSAAINQADPTHMPGDDILGRERSAIDAAPDIGAYEAQGFRLDVEPVFRHIGPGESASYTLKVQPDGAGEPVQLAVGSVPVGFVLDLSSTTIPIPGEASLTLTSTHTTLLFPGLFVRLPVTATSGAFFHTTTVQLLVGGVRFFLPVFVKEL
jgi:hypothetical protein